MMPRWLKWLRRRSRALAAPSLPSVEREEVAHLFGRPGGLPRVDWDMADSWIAQRSADPDKQRDLRRAVAAACLDELRDALPQDHRRWRSVNVEGLAPLEGGIGPAMAATAEKCFRILRRDLRRIRGDEPIPPIGVVAIEPVGSYIDFTDSYFPDEGAFATSGGMYLSDDGGGFPLLAVSAAARHGAEATVAHELTHHALHGAGLPLWIEEGLTQMMEERIVAHSNFLLNAERIERHRDHWSETGLSSFLDGDAFGSPEEDEQELAYHLAQWVVRSMLQERPEAFFAFARACRATDPEACREHLGVTPTELLERLIGLDI